MAVFECRKRLDRTSIRPLYRNRNYKREEREAEKMSKKESWYRSEAGSIQQPEAVVFVTATPGSELRKNISIRVAEKAGVNYILQCLEYPIEDQAVYIGETSTTGYIRGNEHRYQYRHHGLMTSSKQHQQ